jgi:membrane-bound lytic murein transglycosylase F
MIAESGGNPKAVSPVGARGLFQLMGPAAEEVRVTDRDNPEESIRGGTEYLARCLANVKITVGSHPVAQPDLLRFALASYNCGFGYVRVALRDLLANDQPLDWPHFRTALPLAVVRGKKPDHKQALSYVEKILPLGD